MKPILLIGKDGQLGQELQPFLTSIGSLVSVGRDTLDLSQTQEIERLIEKIQPEWVINVAAYTAVDKAESESELALK
ncbi:MAG: sugar nucleotide-binding protein, partial [Planktothrix sp.]